MAGKSIAQAQKNVKLEDLAEARPGPISLTKTEKYIIELAGKFKLMAAAELSKVNRVNTGVLADSIQFTDVVQNGGVLSVDIKVLGYYKFVNYGVKGTVSGRSTNNYSYKKGTRAGKVFAEKMQQWADSEGIKASIIPKKYGLGTEKKGVKFKKPSPNALGYAIANSIIKKGLEPTGFWDKAASEVSKEMERGIGDAFSIDIINELTT
jgi:hypothetical protein